MNILRSLKTVLRHGHHEAIVVTLSPSGFPNPAPMGIDLDPKGLMILKPYLSTLTLKNLKLIPEATINITWDSFIFYRSLYKKRELAFRRSKIVKPPIIGGPIDYYIEGRVRKLFINSKKGRGNVFIEPLAFYRGSGSKLAYSRVDAALIESMIYLTKAEALQNSNKKVVCPLSKRALISLEIAKRLGNREVMKICKDLRARIDYYIKQGCGT